MCFYITNARRELGCVFEKTEDESVVACCRYVVGGAFQPVVTLHASISSCIIIFLFFFLCV